MSRASHRSFTKCLPFHARTCKIQQGRSAKRRPVPQNLHLNKIKDCTSGNTSALEFQIGQFMGCWKIPWHCIAGFEEVCFTTVSLQHPYPANTRSGYRTWAPCTHRFKFETFTGDFFHRKARFERKLAIVHPDVKNGHEKSAVFVALGSNQEDLYKPTMSASMQLKQITLPLVGECLNVSPHLAASQNSSKSSKRDPLGQQHPSQNHILSSPNMHDLEWESAILVSFSPFYIEKVPIWGLNLRSKTYGYIHPAKSPHLYQSMQRPPGRCISPSHRDKLHTNPQPHVGWFPRTFGADWEWISPHPRISLRSTTWQFVSTFQEMHGSSIPRHTQSATPGLPTTNRPYREAHSFCTWRTKDCHMLHNHAQRLKLEKNK